MKTRIVKWEGYYIPQYQVRYFFFFKVWKDFLFYTHRPCSFVFNTRAKAKEFIDTLDQYYHL